MGIEFKTNNEFFIFRERTRKTENKDWEEWYLKADYSTSNASGDNLPQLAHKLVKQCKLEDRLSQNILPVTLMTDGSYEYNRVWSDGYTIFQRSKVENEDLEKLYELLVYYAREELKKKNKQLYEYTERVCSNAKQILRRIV